MNAIYNTILAMISNLRTRWFFFIASMKSRSGQPGLRSIPVLIRIMCAYLFFNTGNILAQTPTLGTYPNATVIAGSNSIITPGAAPTNTSNVLAYTNTNFTGSLLVDPATGAVRVVNAKQIGTFTITVKAFNGSDSAKSSFLLTVIAGACTNGTFGTASNISAGNSPVAIATGDFNNDGVQDLAIVNAISKNVSIRLGNGSGGFTGSTTISVAPLVTAQPNAIVVGDFNGDGNQDFATANWCDTGSVSVRLGNGSGNFSGSTELQWGAASTITNSRALAIGDFNGDKIQDLAVASYQNNRVYLYIGNGSGGFSLSNTFGFAVGTGPYGIVVGDFNGDGKHDIATANNTGGTISRCLGDGGGGLSTAISWTAVASGSLPTNIALCDINNDGKQDLAVSLYSSNLVAVYRGNGNGSFFTSAPKAVINTGSASLPNHLAIGDFNGDGRQDIAHANASTLGKAGVALFASDSFNFVTDTLYACGTNSKAVCVGDFNNDGILDLAVANSTTNNVSLLQGNPSPLSINVQGNGTSIADGDATPSPSDHTNFTAGVFSRVYTIQNTGSVTLSITNITLTGVHASDFSLSGIPTSIAVNSTASFTVTFSPAASGTRFASVHIFSPVCLHPDYDFAISATDCTAPSISCASDSTIGSVSTCNALVNYTLASISGYPTPGLTYVFTGATTGNGSGSGSGATFNKGVTGITITATNSCGTATCNFNITVIDNTAPALTCVTNQTRNTSIGNCTYTGIGTEFDPVVSDNCSGTLTTVNNFNNTTTLNGAVFNIGTTNVIWTVTDASNNTATCSFTILVTDNQTPVISCIANQTRNAGNSLCTYTTQGAEFDASFSDNCSGATRSNNINNAASLAGVTFNKGITNIIWTVTDASGNTATCNINITVNDNQNPTVNCVTNQTRNTDTGNCSYVAIGTEFNPSFSDNCPGVSITNNYSNSSSLSGTLFNKGITHVTWTVTDIANNSSTCSFSITVNDNEPPISLTKNITVALTGGTASITATGVDNGSSDNCGNVSLAVSPATFNNSHIGNNVVVLTVTDQSGNSSTATSVVTVTGTTSGVIPTVSIAAVNQPEFCQGGYIILKTTVTNTLSYLWSTGATTPSIEVNTSGTYTVTVKSSTGHTATANISINYNASNLLSAYTIIAQHEVELKDGSVLKSGGAGVLSTCGEIEVEGNSKITAAGTFAKAKNIEVKCGGAITNKIYAVPSITLPSFKSNPYGNSHNNKTVGQYATVTLTDSIFDKVNLGRGSTVIFTRPVIYINDLNLGEDSKVRFTSSCVQVRLRREFKVDKGSFINPDNKSVVIYCAKKVDVKKGSTVISSIYSLEDIKANGECRDSVTLIGQFIATGDFDAKNTVIYANPSCGACTSFSKTSPVEEVADEKGLVSSDKLQFKAYPNPGNGNFMLDFITPEIGIIQVVIYDYTGKEIYSNNLESDGSLVIPVNLTSMPTGYYLVRVVYLGEIYTKRLLIQTRN